MKEPKAFSPGLGSAQGTGERTPVLNPPQGCAVLWAQSKLQGFSESLLWMWCCPCLPKINISASCLLLCDSIDRGGSGCLLCPCTIPILGTSFTPSWFYVSPQNLPSKAEPWHIPGLQGLQGTGQSP